MAARIIVGIAAFAMVILLFTRLLVEPWIEEKIQTSLRETPGDYLIKIEKVHVSVFRSGIELKNISLQSKPENEGQSELSGSIESVKFKGIQFIKALFSKDIVIREVDVFNCNLTGKVAFPEKTGPARISPLNLSIKTLFFDKLLVDVKSTTTAQAYSLKDGSFKVYGINVEKTDTLSSGIFNQFDFDVSEFKTVTSDSMYSFTALGINYSATSGTLTADSFVVQPNYTDYEFTAKSHFVSNRFEGRFSRLSVHNFSAPDFIKSGNITSSYIEIGEAELDIFRDKRKVFPHIQKPTFQDIIYNYQGALNIDSIGILGGNIVYSEHADEAIEKGSVSFTEIDARIYKITNDTIFKTEKAYLGLKANALFMGKGKLTVLLKARIFDSQNTFAVNGRLTGMDASEINPILAKIAFVSITAGRINGLSFSFSANNTMATGSLRLLYDELKFEIMNKQTGETTALVEQVKSLIANLIVLESNPIPGEEVRTGIIEYERDPEKFLFNYIVKAILTGIKSSITKPKSHSKSKR